MRVKNMLNYHEFDNDNEINILPSMTIPDQVMSIREILDRFSRGLPTPQFNGVYEGEEYFPDIRTLDLTERQELLEQTRERIKQLTTNVENNNERVLEKESISGEPSTDL